ncbi:MAG TPA: hypothetical protein ENJ99_02790 [Rhizobiales bacterium]|nr:hypothetical protein [Hyphomicrobiales bacterium]
MRKIFQKLTLAAAMTIAGSLSALAHGGVTVFTGSSGAANARGVHVFYPERNVSPPRDTATPERDARRVRVDVDVVVRYKFAPYFYRRLQHSLALGQKYPGFVRGYSGPKYPF